VPIKIKSLQQFLPLLKAKIQGLLHAAQAKLGYFLGVFSVSPAAINTV
jgi:hypothetical protein